MLEHLRQQRFQALAVGPLGKRHEGLDLISLHRFRSKLRSRGSFEPRDTQLIQKLACK